MMGNNLCSHNDRSDSAKSNAQRHRYFLLVPEVIGASRLFHTSVTAYFKKELYEKIFEQLRVFLRCHVSCSL